ncbi:hypothetical protein CIHG_01283 [Coccidioides immitis H538.4]|uniref:Uncharacterized protein n=1 Tax=Coccidioides immitis H538.4 TaxID=396776 RepID=A0A0J8RFV5_COCIT|nr:hypothetical protein CIHG_01283 [Coccidioides immitis H538.4]
MDISQTVASWLSLAATVIGLGSIVTQFGSLIDSADPFRALRDLRHLGRWMLHQPHIPWYRVLKPPPVGPVIAANLPHGLCGRKTVHISRLPLTQPAGKAGWSVILAVIHSPPSQEYESGSYFIQPSKEHTGDMKHITTIIRESLVDVSKGTWDDLPLRPLLKHRRSSCVVISRTTLMALFCVTNARPAFRHSGASGFRAAYPSYCGQWLVEWPLGDIAHVKFAAHDSHAHSRDVYPMKFQSRVDRCLQMLAGVVYSSRTYLFQMCLSRRKSSRAMDSEVRGRGFGGAHGSRHLYNMIEGNVNEVDFLSMKPLGDSDIISNMIRLDLPSSEGNNHVVDLFVPEEEARALNRALDCLPWSSLSWSIHRGMRDILVAFAKPRMDRYRDQLAETLRSAVDRWPEKLVARGWDAQFIRRDMAHMATSAVAAGSGNSGDVVRIVTDIAMILWDGTTAELDETTFWRYDDPVESSPVLSPMAVVALVKCFVLEWSVDLDYQMYHDLPLELYLG